jgi:hypothetical protein
MRVFLVAAAVVAVAAGCGGQSKPLGETARPCLSRLGMYVHHVPLPITATSTTVAPLPVLDPDFRPVPGLPTHNLAWSDELQEYGEVSFHVTGRGANAVQILIFRNDELPKRAVAATKRAQRQATFFAIRGLPTLRDRTIVIWSSVPTAQQKRGVYRCLDA